MDRLIGIDLTLGLYVDNIIIKKINNKIRLKKINKYIEAKNIYNRLEANLITDIQNNKATITYNFIPNSFDSLIDYQVLMSPAFPQNYHIFLRQV